jgi:hypothetical protein
MEQDLRKNPALLKLDLYCRGIRIDEEFTSEEEGGRKILRTRAGLGSGLEAVLPGGLWTNIPVVEPFAAKSPYKIRVENGEVWIDHDEIGPVTPIQLAPKPDWYDMKTSTGKPMTRIGSLQGTYLGVYPSKVCEYWLDDPKDQCRYCSVGLNLGADDDDEKSVQEVIEVVKAARKGSGITYVDFNTGHYEGETYLDILEPYIRRVKEETGVLIGVQTPPHSDLKRYHELRKIGVNRVSFCFELYNRERFETVCPGKHKAYGLDRYLEAVEYCAREVGPTGRDFEPWVVNGEIIAGLESAQDSIDAINWITDVGAVPTVCVFRPLVGTDFADEPVPSTEDMVLVFRRLYEACMEKGIMIGVAPNVNVSLVMLPREARLLQDNPKKYWMQELKLKALTKAFTIRFNRELRRADARQADYASQV